MDNELLLTKVLEVYRTCNITSTPIDCFRLLQNYGFRIFTYDALKISNPELYYLCLQYSNEAFIHRRLKVAVYNDKNNAARIRFSLMHELGHIVLETNSEDDADNFASCVLAPRILIHTGGYRTSDAIHDAFGLSYTASNRALLAYKEWFWIISHSRPRCPSPPEKQLELIFFPEEVPDQTAIGEEDSCSEQSSYCGYRGFSGLSDQQQWYYAKGL